MHSAVVRFFLSAVLICYGYLQIFFQKSYYMCLYIVILCCLLFMEQKYILCCLLFMEQIYFVLLAVHGTEICFQLSHHSFLDQSPYNGLMKLMVCMLCPQN